MKRLALVAAAAVVFVASAFALFHAWRNRSGPLDSGITLTERELSNQFNPREEDSGVSLHLVWFFDVSTSTWLDRVKLRELGFNTRLAPSDSSASRFYQRQLPRRAFVALEYNGPAWHKWFDDVERKKHAQFPQLTHPPMAYERDSYTRLMAIDAASDAAQLRNRHPNRASLIIVPALIRISLRQKLGMASVLTGGIEDVPSSIHVPLPFSAAFRSLPANPASVHYTVHLRYGAELEPWVTGVNFPTPP